MDNPHEIKRNKRYWVKLKHLSEYYSNSISRQIINKCVEQKAEVIVLPEFQEEYSGYVMRASGKWSGLHLSGRIREQLKYKAWQQGILVLETPPIDCGGKCAVCGAGIRRLGTEILCDNGHRGNRYLNFAGNLGLRCIRSFQEGDGAPAAE